jgi:hypothetical protein
MPLTNTGADHIAGLIIGTGTSFNNGTARIGVGNSNAAFNAAQTDLQGASVQRKLQEPTYPLRAANVLTFRSLFTTAEANFAWEEWGLFNQAAAGIMLCRKVEPLGTKTSAQSWQLTVSITVSPA